mmetsp:Transcript_3094/g.9435  ORF Transcript_3094/g.9435 Transcript_3094/m.9435 type:complete len:260 (+) Transcript_3094:2300-3079(+)
MVCRLTYRGRHRTEARFLLSGPRQAISGELVPQEEHTRTRWPGAVSDCRAECVHCQFRSGMCWGCHNPQLTTVTVSIRDFFCVYSLIGHLSATEQIDWTRLCSGRILSSRCRGGRAALPATTPENLQQRQSPGHNVSCQSGVWTIWIFKPTATASFEEKERVPVQLIGDRCVPDAASKHCRAPGKSPHTETICVVDTKLDTMKSEDVFKLLTQSCLSFSLGRTNKHLHVYSAFLLRLCENRGPTVETSRLGRAASRPLT